MSERLEALTSKLTPGVLSIIRDYDSHPVSDLIREIEFERHPRHVYAASSLRLKNCLVWPPLAKELRRRLKNNSAVMPSGIRGVYLPIFSYDVRIWTMCFSRWQFETLEDLDYLPLWVREEYMLKVR